MSSRPPQSLRTLLSEGDRRTVGQVSTVVDLVLADCNRLAELIPLITDPQPELAMRAADATGKISRDHADWLQPYRRTILRIPEQTSQPEPCWHWCQIIPRLQLTSRQVTSIVDRMVSFLDSPSSILKTFALQGLVDMCDHNPKLVPRVRKIVAEAARTGTKAMQARARKLIQHL